MGSAFKEEFQKFDSTLARVQSSILKAQDELEKLIGVRTRVMIRKLDKISNFEESLEKSSEEKANEAPRDFLEDLQEEKLSAESHRNLY